MQQKSLQLFGFVQSKKKEHKMKKLVNFFIILYLIIISFILVLHIFLNIFIKSKEIKVDEKKLLNKTTVFFLKKLI